MQTALGCTEQTTDSILFLTLSCSLISVSTGVLLQVADVPDHLLLHTVFNKAPSNEAQGDDGKRQTTVQAVPLFRVVFNGICFINGAPEIQCRCSVMKNLDRCLVHRTDLNQI